MQLFFLLPFLKFSPKRKNKRQFSFPGIEWKKRRPWPTIIRDN